MSDYEEMLVHRNPTYKEPIYSKEELIEQVRESRRKAIVIERARLKDADARIILMTPYLPRTVVVNGKEQTVAKPQLAELQERVAAASRAMALPRTDEQALRAAAARHGMALEEKSAGGASVKFSGTYAGMPLSVTSDNYFSAQLSNVSQLWPAGQNPITVPTVTPALPALWATGQSGLNLTGAGTRIGLFEVGAVFDGTFYRTPDGDEGGYDTLRSPGTAKNALTVGSLSVTYGFNGGSTTVTLDESSGRGPTDDGRIKPEIVAKGVDAFTADNGTTPQPLKNQFGGGTSQAYQVISGTSFASPSVAGGLNLCAQRYAQLYPLRQALHAATWRALAVHGATNLGALGPEFRWGYGLFNAAAITILLQSDFNSGSDAFIKEAPLFMEATGQPRGFIEFLVRATGGTADLKFTIAWTDPAGDIPASITPDGVVDILKNDIGLTIIAPDGTVWRPWILNPDATNKTQAVREQAATRGVNNTDNLEQVLIPAANVTPNGIYRVRIERDDVMTTAMQWVSIAGSGITPQPQPRPLLQVSKLTKGVAANTWLVEWLSIVGRDYQVQISPNLQTWTDVGSAATASKELMSLLVTVPAGNAKYFFRVRETQ